MPVKIRLFISVVATSLRPHPSFLSNHLRSSFLSRSFKVLAETARRQLGTNFPEQKQFQKNFFEYIKLGWRKAFSLLVLHP
ncbi:MAG: hypothetical protein ONB46_03560 [candidate division KSB1 bacterium]|nr:hypothetical protein [candidate division KSB1 bacterium]MDZ7365003.1 hypothetical protein [candidate division KSB1 bacterium]MDZ7403398.1 hypothetical protein [candidate division KSB1 bacterium]